MPTTEAPAVIVYRGIRFRRFPDSPNRSDRVYYTPGGSYRKRGVGRLHQEIWKDLHGPIPEGHHVHHADHDPLNNDPANLVLLVGREHLSHHSNTPEAVERNRASIEVARPYAAAWHSTEEGLAWHAENGRQSWEGREDEARTCEYCAATFTTKDRKTATRFCSNNCKVQARRVSGVDNETRTCPACGRSYEVNKYSKAKGCSRKCGAALRTDR